MTTVKLLIKTIIGMMKKLITMKTIGASNMEYKYLDGHTIELLAYHHDGIQLEHVKSQMNAIMEYIEVNQKRYTYSKDFREAIDGMIKYIVAGKLLLKE